MRFMRVRYVALGRVPSRPGFAVSLIRCWSRCRWSLLSNFQQLAQLLTPPFPQQLVGVADAVAVRSGATWPPLHAAAICPEFLLFPRSMPVEPAAEPAPASRLSPTLCLLLQFLMLLLQMSESPAGRSLDGHFC